VLCACTTNKSYFILRSGLLISLEENAWLQMDYINTSHPNFVGGSRAVELAIQQQRGMKVSYLNLASLQHGIFSDSVIDCLFCSLT